LETLSPKQFLGAAWAGFLSDWTQAPRHGATSQKPLDFGQASRCAGKLVKLLGIRRHWVTVGVSLRENGVYGGVNTVQLRTHTLQSLTGIVASRVTGRDCGRALLRFSLGCGITPACFMGLCGVFAGCFNIN
jgi:hypothetical protein